MSSTLDYFLLVLAITSVLSGLFVYLFSGFGKHGTDTNHGPQKIHSGAVPRIGGLAIFVSVIFAAFAHSSAADNLLFLFIAAAIPVFLLGILEDLTGRVPPIARLLASFVTGGLFVVLTGLVLTTVDVGMIDALLKFPIIAIPLTILSIAVLSQAFNIIDGLNGLAGTTALIITCTFSMLASSTSPELMSICVLLSAAVAGFLLFNFPMGKIFLGDGGAYFIGAMIAMVAIATPTTTSDLSPFAVLLIIFYPLYEVVRSTIRRTIKRGKLAFRPDNKHLHSLVFAHIRMRTDLPLTTQNSLSSLIVMTLPLVASIWAIIFASDQTLLMIGLLLWVFLYEAAMWLVVRSVNTPK